MYRSCVKKVVKNFRGKHSHRACDFLGLLATTKPRAFENSSFGATAVHWCYPLELFTTFTALRIFTARRPVIEQGRVRLKKVLALGTDPQGEVPQSVYLLPLQKTPAVWKYVGRVPAEEPTQVENWDAYRKQADAAPADSFVKWCSFLSLQTRSCFSKVDFGDRIMWDRFVGWSIVSTLSLSYGCFILKSFLLHQMQMLII